MKRVLIIIFIIIISQNQHLYSYIWFWTAKQSFYEETEVTRHNLYTRIYPQVKLVARQYINLLESCDEHMQGGGHRRVHINFDGVRYK